MLGVSESEQKEERQAKKGREGGGLGGRKRERVEWRGHTNCLAGLLHHHIVLPQGHDHKLLDGHNLLGNELVVGTVLSNAACMACGSSCLSLRQCSLHGCVATHGTVLGNAAGMGVW